MATIKIEIVAGAQTVTNTKTVSNPDLVRFIAAYKKIAVSYGGLASDATDAQVLTHWSESIYKNARELTKQSERDAAILAVTEIAMT